MIYKPFLAISFSLLLLCGGCGGSGGKKFNPQEKKTTMTDSQREAAIAEKRAEVNRVDTALIFGSNQKLTVLKPAATGKMTEAASNLIGQRMLDMLTENGIGGVGGDPAMVFACGITNVSTKLTATAPQKTMVTLDAQYYVANVASGTVFGSLSEQITGVGDNEQQAYMNAAREIKNSNKMQQLLKSANEKIISYYNGNAAAIRAEVEGLIAKNDYERAYSLLRGVPEQSALFQYSQQQLPAIAQKMLVRDAAENLAHFKSALAANMDEYSDVVGDIMALIPVNTPQYAEAQAAFSKYLTDMDIRNEKKAKIEAEKADREHREKMEMLVLDAKIAHQDAVDGRWDKGFEILGDGVKCARDVGITFGRNSSWTSFLNPSNLVSSVKEAFNK